jgi:hypothetical protein
MGGEQPPSLRMADLADRSKGNIALAGVHLERLLPKRRFRILLQPGSRSRRAMAWHIVVAVNCTGLSGEVRSIATKSN